MTQIRPKDVVSFRINVLVFEAFSNMILACLLEPFRVVRDGHGANIVWNLLTPHDAPLQSSSGLTLTPDCRQSDAGPCDLFIVLGGDRFRMDATQSITRRSLVAINKAKTVIAADTGAWLLASAGYLDGRQATLHWQLLDEFANNFSKVRTVSTPFAADGKWLTCGSAAGALELALQEITTKFGAAARFDAASMFLNAPRLAEEPLNRFSRIPAHPNIRVRRVLDIMSLSLENPLDLSEIAKQSGLTLRTMARLFAAEMKISPGKCYQHMRLSRARELMDQQGMKAADAASLCGFSCAAALNRALKANLPE